MSDARQKLHNAARGKPADNGRPPDADEPREQLEKVLGLGGDVHILGARMVGRGGEASVDIPLSNGETLTFDSVRKMIQANVMLAELVACAGVTPKLNQAACAQAVALARSIADRTEGASEDDISTGWGIEFLQAADVLDADITQQAERWGAFAQLGKRDPYEHMRNHGGNYAAGCLVLRDTASAERLVRTTWFAAYVRRMSARETPKSIDQRMTRVGWHRRGREGRIKATSPTLGNELIWTFYIVPEGWGDDPGQVTP